MQKALGHHFKTGSVPLNTFVRAAPSRFAPELTPSPGGVMRVGPGRLAGSSYSPARSSGGARDPLHTQAKKKKKVEEANMEAEALVPLLPHCPEHYRFSSFCDIDIPSQFLSSLEPSCICCVLFCLFSCILWLEGNVPVFALASLPLARCYLGERTNQTTGLLFPSTTFECQNVSGQFL